ncbi:MAG: TonB-dependent receptor [Nitrospirae bacterium]|nr:TonB-dependent receptor [Nitrospirota bacterium]
MRRYRGAFTCFTLTVLLLLTQNSRAEDYVSASAPALGQMSIEELMQIEVATVQTASKYVQKVSEAPSAISVITSEEIRKYGYRTLADLLRSVRSFYITHDRNYSFTGVRGFGRPGDYNTRLLLLVDGHRINDNIYDQAFVGTEFILDIDLIERVEIIRGPGSSLYGANAFFGIINVITRSVSGLKGAEVSGEAGSFRTYKGRLSYGGILRNGPEMVLSASTYESKGRGRLFFREFDDPATNNGFAENADYDRFNSSFAKISYKGLTIHGGYVYRKKGVPTAAFGTLFNDPGTYAADERAYLEMNYEQTFEKDLRIISRLSYDQYSYHGHYVTDPLIVNKDFARGRWWGAEIKAIKTLFERHKVILGAEYQDNTKQDQGNYDEAVYLDDRRRSENWGVYIQDEFAILDTLILNAGVRHDRYDTFGSTTNPRLALIFSPARTTALKLIYGTAFRAPNAYELYYNDGGDTQKANPGLRPETITTYELVLETSFDKAVRGAASIFHYDIRNLISQQVDPSDGLIFFSNADEIEASGLEIEIDGRCSSGLEGRISYTFQESREKRTKGVLSNSPRHLVKFGMAVPLIRELVFAGIELQYTGRRKTLSGNSAAGFFLTNLTFFSRNLAKGLEITASVYNLFDKRYGDPGSTEHRQDIIEQDGRSFRFKMTYGF